MPLFQATERPIERLLYDSMLPTRIARDSLPAVMARQFKPVRFFVMMAVAAFVVCGVTAFYTQRTAHGRTAEERSAYAIGEKAGQQAPAGAKLATAAELNMMAQKYFKQQGSGEQQSWDLAFENGYTRIQEDTSPAVNRS